MFLVILLFFFTNVYMWHDSATREMNTVLSEKMNSRISLDWVSTAEHDGLLNVTNMGGSEVELSRLWIISQANPPEHIYFDLEQRGIRVAAGNTTTIEVGTTANGPLTINYDPASAESFEILTTLGNTAACSYSTFLSSSTSSLIVELEARPYNIIQSFDFFSPNIPDHPSFTLSSSGNIFIEFKDLAPGHYIIGQNVPANWTLEGIFGATSYDFGTGRATIDVVSGQSYHIRFVNQYITGP